MDVTQRSRRAVSRAAIAPGAAWAAKAQGWGVLCGLGSVHP